MKKLNRLVVITAILVMSIKPAIAKPHLIHRSTLKEYIGTLCKRSCVNAATLKKIVHAASRKHRVPKNLILAVMKEESGFQHTARSKGNYGLMQVNLTAHPEIDRSKILNIETNIDAGTRILSKCFKHHRNTTQALTCYKTGDVSTYNREVKRTLIVLASLSN